jgi:hypothetical protein
MIAHAVVPSNTFTMAADVTDEQDDFSPREDYFLKRQPLTGIWRDERHSIAQRAISFLPFAREHV